jgi:hypothetical protein
MTLRFLTAAILVILAGVVSPASAATLTINAFGKLTGATGVDVGGTLYDVAFVDGSCITLFSGCDSVTDFAFTTPTAADAASQALLDQVFTGNFDADPSLTFGCATFSGCGILTPWEMSNDRVSLATMVNGISVDFIFLSLEAFPSTYDTAPDRSSVYADWTVSAAPVPEPASFALIAVGLAGFGVRRWWQRKA